MLIIPKPVKMNLPEEFCLTPPGFRNVPAQRPPAGIEREKVRGLGVRTGLPMPSQAGSATKL